MPKLNGKDLASLYPTPKTFDELEVERERREALRRPKFVPLKISFWITLGIVTVLAAYQIGKHVMMNNLSSAGEVIFATFSSFLIILITGAILLYLYLLTTSLVVKAFIFTSKLYGALISILFIASMVLALFIQSGYSEVMNIVLVALVFLCTYLAVSLMSRCDGKGSA